MPIQILPPQLANQIAAGEVVERPASIVKECVENAIDAGAQSINISLLQGGHKRIVITDDGSGISKDELPLALARHATSKIATLDDLENVLSLGFRGEALASISAVSRCRLTSRIAEQDEAWTVYAQGPEQDVVFEPAAHPVGTTIDVADLFFNTPARRKFLKSPKTEFQHVLTLVKRIALSRPDIGFTLMHNDKRILRVRPKQTSVKRIADVVSKDFADNALLVSTIYEGVTINGWISPALSGHSDNQQQYVFVNQRMMRDKLINHAIRQAYEGLIDSQLQPSFVLFITLPPSQVDINVHPAKHEVRFANSRVIHDFIYHSIVSILQDNLGTEHTLAGGLQELPEHHYRERGQNPANTLPHSDADQQQLAQDYILPLPSQADGSRDTGRKLSGTSSAGTAGRSARGLFHSDKPSQQAINATAQFYQPDASALPIQLCLLPNQQLLLCKDELRVSAPQQWVSALVTHLATYSESASPLLLPVSLNIQREVKVAELDKFDIQLINGHSSPKIMLKKVPSRMRQLPWSQLFAHWVESSVIGMDSLNGVMSQHQRATAQLYNMLLDSQTGLMQACIKSLWHSAEVASIHKGGNHDL